jgi:hypothetical protein
MNNTSEKMLRSMCQFLALSDKDKLEFLPASNPEVKYQVNEMGDQTDNPLYYYCNAFFEFIDRYHEKSGDFSELIRDIGTLLAIMIEQRSSYGFIWHIDKIEIGGIWGPADRVWNILRRLAIQALSERKWPQGFPEVPFCETGRTGKWHGT